MRSALRYGLIVMLLAAFASCGKKGAVKLPDMNRNYSKRSTKPFGTFVAFRMLAEKYKQTGVETLSGNFYKNWVNHLSGIRSLYVAVSKRVLLSDKDLTAMMYYVANGNQVFLAAEYIDKTLLDTLGVQVESNSLVSLFQNQVATAGQMRYSTLQLNDSSFFGKKRYGIFYYPFEDHFVKTDSLKVNILGLNDGGDPDYISVVYGKGRFFFHLHPQSLSNYFLLSKNNKEYAENAFSYFPADRYSVYWDDYFRLGQQPNESFSSFAVFMKYPMLKWALLMAIALMLLYIAFGSKRRQRPVPVKNKNANASISFVETIGRLYLQKKDNHNIAHKMITYFMEQIRSQHYLNTSQLNAEFFSSLAKKTGVEETIVKDFFQFISKLQDAEKVTDEQLLELNNRMQFFIK